MGLRGGEYSHAPTTDSGNDVPRDRVVKQQGILRTYISVGTVLDVPKYRMLNLPRRLQEFSAA